MSIVLPEEIHYIFNKLKDNGYESYVVGGCLRDLILGIPVSDFDLATDAKPEELMKIFDRTIPTGIKHGTVTLLIKDKAFEITTYRLEGIYSDHRHPDEVKFTSSIVEDLSRRDFTINAMAYNEKGLLDPFNGTGDLKLKIIRTVGDANLRFSEDALRMIRAIRFSCKLSFDFDNAIIPSIQKSFALIENISHERIREELNKILLSSKPSKGIYLLEQTNLLRYIIPELIPCIGFNQRNPHHDKDVYNHILSVLDFSENNLVGRLCALFHDIGKPECFSIDKKGIGHFYNHNKESEIIAYKILSRLKYDNTTIKKVCLLIKEHMCIYEGFKDITVKKLINRVGQNNLPDLFSLLEADSRGHKKEADFSKMDKLQEKVSTILKSGDPLTIRDLRIDGEDLINMGFNRGPIIGATLKTLLEIVMMRPEDNNKEKLLQKALKLNSISHT
ncbi:MAG TPA: HD domain-containing protein [Clostridiaceae bacterium]